MSGSSFSPGQQCRLNESPIIRAVLELAGAAAQEVWLVGGCVRDLVRGEALNDVDVALAGALPFARAFAERTGGTYVPWRTEWGMARVALPGPRIVDFAELRGRTIEEDLRARDLTINALAAAPGPVEGEWQLIDPLGGQEDLAARIIRAASRRAFADDPLRVLRAFRFAAQLRGAIEAETLGLIGARAPGLAGVAAERVRAEMVKLFAASGTAEQIRVMDEVGVVEALWPEARAMRGVDQPGFHHLDVWEHSVATLEELDAVLAELPALYGEDAEELARYLEEGEHRAWLKFAALWHDVAKPETKTLEGEGRARFFGHAELGAERVQAMLRRLACGQRETGLVTTVIALHLRPLHMLPRAGVAQLSPRAVRRFCRAAQGHADGVLLLAVADTRATRGPLMAPEKYREFVALHRELRRVRREALEPVEREAPLLTGQDLIEELGLEPGPGFREILEAVAEARVEGELTTREEALQFVRERYASRRGEP